MISINLSAFIHHKTLMLQELELLAASVIGAQCRQLALDCILTRFSLSLFFLSLSIHSSYWQSSDAGADCRPAGHSC